MEEKIRMRKVDDLLIMFYDKRTVFVKHHYGVSCYHRWWVRERGYHARCWKPFCESLARTRRHLTWGDVNALAERFDISVTGGEMPKVKEEDIKWLA